MNSPHEPHISKHSDTTNVAFARRWADEYPKMVASGIARELGAIEVVQEAGDTIYVPMGWWHTVLNLEFSVAVTANFLQVCAHACLRACVHVCMHACMRACVRACMIA